MNADDELVESDSLDDELLDEPPPLNGAFLDDLFSAPIDNDEMTGDILLPQEEEEEAGVDEEGNPIIVKARSPEVITKAKDAKGHEHKGKGPGGGQFTSTESSDEFAPGAGKGYNNKKLIKNVRENYAEELTAESHEGADKDVKRPGVSQKGAYIGRNRYLLMRQKSATKIQHVANHKNHRPTAKEKRENKAKIKAKGANAARRDLNGNNTQRRERKIALAVEFGDGKTCGCVYCGLVISYSPKYSKYSMEEDKINETAAGGKYKVSNLLPACVSCNRSRGDKPAIDYLVDSTYGQK